MSSITRQEYRDYDALNYSRLSDLDKHPSKVHEERELSEGATRGDILDTLLFDGEEKFHEDYHVSTLDDTPSDTIIEIIEGAKPEGYSEDALLLSAERVGYGGDNWKPSTILGKIMDKGEAYIEDLQKAEGKTVVSWELFSQMQRAASTLKQHEFTKDFFTEGWEYQVPYSNSLELEMTPPTPEHEKEKVETAAFKGLLDGINLELDFPTIFDLKFTSHPLNKFKGQFFKWRYDLQTAIYADLVWKTEEKIQNTGLRYLLVVYSGYENSVRVFQPTSTTLAYGRDGGHTYTGALRKGYRQLAKDFLWHEKHNKWDHPREVYENDGVDLIRHMMPSFKNEFNSWD